WNRRQTYRVTKLRRNGRSHKQADDTDLRCPPCNIGPRSTPNYESLAASAVSTLHDGEKAFAGQRADPFFVDLGSVSDLGTLRPFGSLHLIPTANAPGVDALKSSNVHTLAIQVPISELTRNGSVPSDPMSATAVLGIWAGAERQKALVRQEDRTHTA